MGNHGRLLHPHERWEIVKWIKHLSAMPGPDDKAAAGTDSTAKAGTPVAAGDTTKSGKK
jgi:hypothetical protein